MFIFKNKNDNNNLSKVITILAGLALIGDQIVIAGLMLIVATIFSIIYDL